METQPRSEFPRPDFQREHWQCLNGEWDFRFDFNAEIRDAADALARGFDRKITVPFCYQSKLSGIGDERDCDAVWYRRAFDADAALLDGRAALLKFGAVDYRADVWLNGTRLGGHEGGHTPFEFDVTGVLRAGANELIVRAEDGLEVDKSRGKQSWMGERYGCWYTPTTGIWQSVWLEYAGAVYFRRVKITPDARTLTAECEVFLSSRAEVEVDVTPRLDVGGEPMPLGSQRIVCRGGYGRCVLAFPDFDIRPYYILWAPNHPNLIYVDVRVCGEGGDAVSTYFGMRSVSAQGDQILLGGDVCYLRFVLDQGYWPESLLTPPSDEAIVRDIELTKAMGFNGARKHQKIEDPRYYYHADRLGLLVSGELPAAYLFDDAAVTRTQRELTEFVERDYNHPSLVMWTPLNESWGAPNILTDARQQSYARLLLYLLKTLDPVRLVSANDGWEQPDETDVCAIHDYKLFPDNLDKYEDMARVLASQSDGKQIFARGSAYRGQPVLMSEYGGIAFDDGAGENWGYYGKVKNEREFLARLEPVTSYLLDSGRFAGFCYTQLTDVMQECNGLLTAEREAKVPLEKLKAVFGKGIWGR